MGEQDIGDIESIRQAIERWMQAKLPDRPGLRLGELAFPKSSGESSVTLIVDATWPDGTVEKFVVRMVPPVSQVFDRHDLAMQVEMMEIMRREGVPAPSVVGFEPDASVAGSEFYVMRFCEGRIPPDNPPMAIAGWVKEDLSPDERGTMWRAGLDVLARIHGVGLDAYDLSRLPRARPGEPVVAQELRTFDAMFKPELREKVDPRIVEGWSALVARPPESEGPALCWGDARPGNIIFRDLEPVAVLDWEMANVSDPLTDLAWWVWIDRCNSEGLGVERLPGLPAPQEIYADWQARTGRSIRSIAWYELFCVVRYAIILERKFAAMRQTHPEMGVPPNFAAEFIPDLMAAARRI